VWSGEGSAITAIAVVEWVGLGWVEVVAVVAVVVVVMMRLPELLEAVGAFVCREERCGVVVGGGGELEKKLEAADRSNWMECKAGMRSGSMLRCCGAGDADGRDGIAKRPRSLYTEPDIVETGWLCPHTHTHGAHDEIAVPYPARHSSANLSCPRR